MSNFQDIIKKEYAFLHDEYGFHLRYENDGLYAVSQDVYLKINEPYFMGWARNEHCCVNYFVFTGHGMYCLWNFDDILHQLGNETRNDCNCDKFDEDSVSRIKHCTAMLKAHGKEILNGNKDFISQLPAKPLPPDYADTITILNICRELKLPLSVYNPKTRKSVFQPASEFKVNTLEKFGPVTLEFIPQLKDETMDNSLNLAAAETAKKFILVLGTGLLMLALGIAQWWVAFVISLIVFAFLSFWFYPVFMRYLCLKNARRISQSYQAIILDEKGMTLSSNNPHLISKNEICGLTTEFDRKLGNSGKNTEACFITLKAWLYSFTMHDSWFKDPEFAVKSLLDWDVTLRSMKH